MPGSPCHSGNLALEGFGSCYLKPDKNVKPSRVSEGKLGMQSSGFAATGINGPILGAHGQRTGVVPGRIMPKTSGMTDELSVALDERKEKSETC